MPSILTFSQALPPLAWILLSSLFFAVGDILFRCYFEYKWTYGFVGALAVSFLGLFFLTMSFPYENIAVATVIAILLNIALYLTGAFLLFGDMVSVREGVGLLVGFSAIVILEGLK